MSENVPPAASAAPSAPAPAPAPVPTASDTTATATATTTATANAATKLTPAQLKAQKKAEKAARRGQIVAAKTVPETAAPAPSDGSKGAAKQTRPKQDNPATPTGPKTPKKSGTAPTTAAVQPPRKPKGPEVPETFSYLAMARKTPLSKADNDVHPAVLAVGQQMASFTLKDNLARLEAMLVAFQLVIEEYEPPTGQTFTRNFLPHCLNPQIDYLIGCRPMCFSMGNAIRMIKAKIANLVELNKSDIESKTALSEAIGVFLQERIIYAEKSIARKMTSLIDDGDILLTYGNPRLVRLSLQRAWAEGRKFEVAIVDDPFDPAGQELAKVLRNHGIRVYYYPNLSGINMHVRRVTKVFLGAEAMFANGSLYAQAGTADIAMAAKDAEVPVTALLETVNCDRERVSVDSLTYNEIDPDQCTADSFRLLFDTTRDRYISMVVTESEDTDASGSTSAILSILKKLDERTS